MFSTSYSTNANCYLHLCIRLNSKKSIHVRLVPHTAKKFVVAVVAVTSDWMATLEPNQKHVISILQ